MTLPSLPSIYALNTRPKKQARALSQLIQNAGGAVLEVPFIEIAPPDKKEKSLAQLQKIKDHDTVIVTSANAIELLLAGLHLRHPTFIATGSATAAALQKAGIKNILLPKTFNSEGILAMPFLQQIKNTSIWICTGENPRPLLFNTLQKRGHQVELIFCYKRVCPDMDAEKLFHTLEKEHINTLIFTSPEILANFATIFDLSTYASLLQHRIVVISDTMVQQAQHLGFQSISLAENATAEAVFHALAS